DGYKVEDFQKAIKLNTKIIHIETPSNPTLTITDIEGIANLAKERNIITTIDNTFASPVNQNPIDLGIDLVMHSATKYLGGHSDILAGAVAGSKEHIEQLWHSAINYGGSLSDMMVWLLERSIKTLGLRVNKQNENAVELAQYLESNPNVERVYYPGLESHPENNLAKKQMSGFGGMMSFELKSDIDSSIFLQSLELIKPSMSLAGVESTMLAPHLTSHALLTQEERDKLNIKDGLIRFSVGIESVEDLKADIEEALQKVSKGLKQVEIER
ncbi:MAG: PLP-dependent aspartate aminotransferase family protein, partial [Flavobacteriaceae bacterium]|nr:PLP-dependent aspartate aminotransferase family protein [Flavobacteriaceae bacterium]